MGSPIHVVAGVIYRQDRCILLALRPHSSDQGGLWEFPGGKVQPHEAPLLALRRELDEELGITVTAATRLIQIHHDYPDKSVYLDVWLIDRWSGDAHGREGQAIRWVHPEEFTHLHFPAANRAIIKALLLPRLYQITPEIGADTEAFLSRIKVCLSAGSMMIQLRLKNAHTENYRLIARRIKTMCDATNSRLILNSNEAMVEDIGASGLHLTAKRLFQCKQRPLNDTYWIGASCHNHDELDHAQNIGLDYALISPVRQTTSHPGAITLDWEGARALAERAQIPVYALGGMRPGDLTAAIRNGFQGIGTLSEAWKSADFSGFVSRVAAAEAAAMAPITSHNNAAQT